MKAFVTSFGEPTTELCVWALERLGIKVELIKSSSSLAEKLRDIYNATDEDFIRVDADVIPNRNVLQLADANEGAWWLQARTYDWYQQDLTHGGVQLIRKEALPALRANIGKHMRVDRPESQMYRLEEFHNPRRCEIIELVCGLHGWQQIDLERVMRVKGLRGQYENYDWELVNKMAEL